MTQEYEKFFRKKDGTEVLAFKNEDPKTTRRLIPYEFTKGYIFDDCSFRLIIDSKTREEVCVSRGDWIIKEQVLTPENRTKVFSMCSSSNFLKEFYQEN